MSNQAKNSEQRIYSAIEIYSCLHFIKLRSPVATVALSSPSSNDLVCNSNIEWWPCLVFANMMELDRIIHQLDLWLSLPRHQINIEYAKLLPASSTCRVALLMGERPPVGNSVVQFDIQDESASSASAMTFILESFDDNFFEFGQRYNQSSEYIKALQQIITIQEKLDEFAESAKENNCDVTSKNNTLAPYKEGEHNDTSPDEVPHPMDLAIYNHSTVKYQTDEKYENVSGNVIHSSPKNCTIEKNDTNAQKCEKSESEALAPLPISKGQSDQSSKVAMRRGKTERPPTSKNVEHVVIPTFKDVKDSLIKGGYTFTVKKCCRPPFICKASVPTGTLCFNSIEALRNDLCAYGVNCRCGTSMDEKKACQCWTEDEKWEIMLWVRYNVIRGPIHESIPVQIISFHQATKYLHRLGYYRRDIESSLITGEQENDIFRYLSRFGLPMEGDEHGIRCDYNAISPEELFSLEYFISTTNYRVKTFTYTFPQTVDSTPSIMAVELDSPTPSSVVRPKRSVAMRHQRDHDTFKKSKVTHNEGGATIISVESHDSVCSKADTPRKSAAKKRNGRKNSEVPKDRTTDSAKSQPRQPAKSDVSGEYRSPMLRSRSTLMKVVSPTANHIPQQRVSLSPTFPPMKFEKVPVPVFDGSDHHKLLSCLDALKLSNCANLPTICPSNETIERKSQFASNIRKVSNFIQAVLVSRGRNGTRNNDEESSAALYICGAPGLGKTSGVHWCCNHIANKTFDNDVSIKICHLNASYLTAQSKPLQLVIKEIATCMGIKAPYPSSSTITKFLCDTKNSAVLIVVIDEVDAFVTESGRATTGTDCLQTLLRWANNPTMRMGLIGISNCMNDNKTSAILELGMFVETIIFSPYSEYELQQILMARVGVTVIASNVIDYIAKKVAASSGDARKALEMAANAVQHRIDQSLGASSHSTDGHLVKMPNVIQANKEEILNIKDRIGGLPAVGKAILCVLTSYAQARGAVHATIGELKQCVSECMRQTGMEDEMVQMDDFLVLLDTLVDSGLLRASFSTTSSNSLNLSQRTLSDVHRQPIYLGLQLEDIEKVLESDLSQTFYQHLRSMAKLQ